MFHLIGVVVIGLIAGVIAKLIMPGKDPGGIIITIVLGVAGALLATFLGRLIGWYEAGESGGLIAGVIGAIILLAIYRLIKKKQTSA
jgi:uncharacterized membrane protein YeaQ/YmgE (transglycosylase-associated protein family)